MKGKIDKYLLPFVCDGYVIGWRGWRVRKYADPQLNEGGPRLLPLTSARVWQPMEAMEAAIPLHPTNDLNINKKKYLGVYAMKTFDILVENWWVHFGLGKGYQDHVVGPVALWGEIITHERGYRAQFGYPLAIGQLAYERDNEYDRTLVRFAPLTESVVAVITEEYNLKGVAQWKSENPSESTLSYHNPAKFQDNFLATAQSLNPLALQQLSQNQQGSMQLSAPPSMNMNMNIMLAQIQASTLMKRPYLQQLPPQKSLLKSLLEVFFPT